MDFPEFGIVDLVYDDEFFEYWGTIELAGHRLQLHFPLNDEKSAEDVVRASRAMLSCICSRFDILVKNA